MQDYIFICDNCKKICVNDEDIEQHSNCNTSDNSKYWSEEYILKNIEYFIELKNETDCLNKRKFFPHRPR